MSSESTPIELSKFKDAIMEISVENCQSVKSQLQNSIEKLLETNDELNDEIEQVRTKIQNLKPDESHDELRDDMLLYLESVDENNQVIIHQKLRIFAINDQLVSRGIENQQDVDKENVEYNRKIDEKLAKFNENTKQAVVYNMLKSDKQQNKEIESKQESEGKQEVQQSKEEKDSSEPAEGIYL